MRRRWLGLSLLVAAMLAAPPTARILGQVRVGGGQALDANLRLGSGGYNSYGRAAVGHRNTARLYQRGYSVSRPYHVRQDHYNTFLEDRHYNVARSTGHYGGRPRTRSGPPRPQAPSMTPAPSPAVATRPPERGPGSAPAPRLMEQISYGIGFYLGQEIRAGLDADGVDVGPTDVIRGFTDGLRDLEPMVPPEQLDAVLAEVREQMQGRMVTRLLAQDPQFRKLSDENLARSRQFHETFGNEQGVSTLDSGIQYKVLDPGQGESPGPTDVVVVNIRISLIDGSEVSRWEGAEVRIDMMVEAGAQILSRMKVGAKWVTAIPPDLAYGAGGSDPDIGPNETILAEVELVEIK